jgi:hypothetical protein
VLKIDISKFELIGEMNSRMSFLIEIDRRVYSFCGTHWKGKVRYDFRYFSLRDLCH